MLHAMKPDNFQGKSISLMHRHIGSGRILKIALVEALVKVCFENVTTEQFLSAMEHRFNFHLEDCTRDEELTFIQFYTLPTTQLKCKKVISIDFFAQCYEALKTSFTVPTIKRELEDNHTQAVNGPKRRKIVIEGTIDLTNDTNVIEIP